MNKKRTKWTPATLAAARMLRAVDRIIAAAKEAEREQNRLSKLTDNDDALRDKSTTETGGGK